WHADRGLGSRRKKRNLRSRWRTASARRSFGGSLCHRLVRRRTIALRAYDRYQASPGLSAGAVFGTDGTVEGVLGFGHRHGRPGGDPDAGRKVLRVRLQAIFLGPLHRGRTEVMSDLDA